MMETITRSAGQGSESGIRRKAVSPGVQLSAPVVWWALAVVVLLIRPASALDPLVLSPEERRFPLSGHVEYLREGSSPWTIDEVSTTPLGNEFRPLPARVWRPGPSRAALWLRFTIRAQARTGAQAADAGGVSLWTLDLGWPLFNRVTLYAPVEGEQVSPHGWRIREAGLDKLTENKDNPSLRLSVFRFPLEPDTAATLYVRIEYESPAFLNPIIYSQQGYQEMARRRAVLLGMYFGLLTTVALFSLLLAPNLRDRSYFWFSLHLVLVASFYMEMDLLMLRDVPVLRLLPPGNLCYFLMGALFLSLAMFVRAFFFSHHPAPGAERLLRFFALLCAGGMASSLWTTSPLLGNYYVVVIMFGMAVMTGAVLVSLRRGFPPAWLFLLGWATAGAGIVRVLLVTHGAGDFSEGGYWGLIRLGTAVYAVALALALSHRLRVFGAEQERKRAVAEAEQHVLRARMQQAQKMESLGMMAGGIAHDFNNLLAAIFLNADLALMKLPAQSPLSQPLNDIKRAGRHMADLARQMLDYTGKGPTDLRPLNLSKLVEDTLPLIHAGLGGRVRLGVEFEQAPPAIAGDATQLRQVLMNLMTNAAEAIESDGSVTIRTRLCHCHAHDFSGADFGHDLPDGDYMCLEVEDTGTGMDESVRPRIFDPFFTTKFTGRGLGLASVLGIVKKHGASLRIITAPGAGTTFRILFPVTDLPAETIEPAPVSEAAYEAAGTLLLVDDDEDLAYVTKLAIENMGFNVLTASSGAQAIDIFRQPGCPVRVVLLDHSMPGMTGMQVIRELRQIRCDVPVILYSGYAEEQVLAPDGAGGPDFFLHKPFDDEALRGALRRVLGA